MATAGEHPGAGPERAFARPLPASGPVTLDPEESNHLVRVRRVAAGDEVVLFDGEGGSARGRVRWADARATVVEVTGAYPDREPARAVRLAVSLPEAGRADAMVSALAELGVAEVVPLVSARTAPDRRDMASRRRDRWERLAREAAKVSGRSRLLKVGEPETLAALLARPAGTFVLLDPDPECPSLLDVLPASGPLPLLTIGPEGGFTQAERDEVARAGVARARLGSTVLRVETAAVAAAAAAGAYDARTPPAPGRMPGSGP